VVLTVQEVKALLARLEGTKRLMAGLLYGSGLRLRECPKPRGAPSSPAGARCSGGSRP
jgi:hypothetical protein